MNIFLFETFSFFATASFYTILVVIFLHNTNGHETDDQTIRQNYVPRGDISMDRELDEANNNTSTRTPRTTPQVLYYVIFLQFRKICTFLFCKGIGANEILNTLNFI